MSLQVAAAYFFTPISLRLHFLVKCTHLAAAVVFCDWTGIAMQFNDNKGTQSVSEWVSENREWLI